MKDCFGFAGYFPGLLNYTDIQFGFDDDICFCALV